MLVEQQPQQALFTYAWNMFRHVSCCFWKLKLAQVSGYLIQLDSCPVRADINRRVSKYRLIVSTYLGLGFFRFLKPNILGFGFLQIYKTKHTSQKVSILNLPQTFHGNSIIRVFIDALLFSIYLTTFLFNT